MRVSEVLGDLGLSHPQIKNRFPSSEVLGDLGKGIDLISSSSSRLLLIAVIASGKPMNRMPTIAFSLTNQDRSRKTHYKLRKKSFTTGELRYGSVSVTPLEYSVFNTLFARHVIDESYNCSKLNRFQSIANPLEMGGAA